MHGGAQQLVYRLAAHLRRIECTRRKAETIFGRQEFVRRDIELVYMGLFLEAVTSFEGFLEGLFVALVCKTLKHPCRKVKPKVTFKSWVVCHEVIKGTKAYAEWMPYDNTLKRAEAFLVQGLPFSALDSDKTSKLKKISFIRNAIAHRSRAAEERFHSHVIAGSNLLSHEKTPAGYLRSIFALTPAQTRYQESVYDMVAIARQLLAPRQNKP